MFENQTQPTQPVPSQNKIEDIFAGTEQNNFNPLNQSQPMQVSSNSPEQIAGAIAGAGAANKRLFLVGGIVAGLLVLAVAVWLILSSMGGAKKDTVNVVDNSSAKEQGGLTVVETATTSNSAQEAVKAVVKEEVVASTTTNDVAATTSVSSESGLPANENLSASSTAKAGAIDTDFDGLSDSEEAKLSTNPIKTDSDEDGLTDYEEIKVYGSDPLKADSDGDTFTDGAEVKAGYNPNGAGKLFDMTKK